MWELIQDWGWPIGGLVVVGVIWLLFEVSNRLRKKREAEYQKNEREALEAQRARETKAPRPKTYDEMVWDWNRLMEKRQQDINRAHQDAQVMAVEHETPVLLTINDYYATLDDQPIFKIEPLPLGDPRRKELGESIGEVVVDDQRALPHEQAGYGFLPKPQRDAWVETCKRRREAIKAGSLNKTRFLDPAQRSLTPPERTIPGGAFPIRVESKDTKLQSDIDKMATYQKNLNSKADDAFAEELVNIVADAESKARVMMSKEARRQSLDAEAKERGVDVTTVEAEFIQLVVDAAVARAKSSYKGVSPGILAALTPDRIIKGDMFTH